MLQLKNIEVFDNLSSSLIDEINRVGKNCINFLMKI